MKHANYFSMIPALALLSTAPAFGQAGKDTTGTEQKPSQEQGQELRLPTYIKAPVGTKATVLNAEEQQLGTVRDHIIEPRSGKLLFIAVGALNTGDDARLVPYDRFTWDAKKQRLLLPLTAEELRSMPAYDRDSLIASDRADDEVEIDDVDDEMGDEVSDQVGKQTAKKHVATTMLFGSEVVATNEPFATVSELIIEPEKGLVAFVLADSEDAKTGPFVIPWDAMTWEAAKTEDGESDSRFVIARSTDELADAPKLERGDLAALKQPRTLEQIFAYYELEAPIAKERKVVSRG